MSFSSGESTRELLVLAVTAAQALSKGRSSQEIERLAAFFNVLGDTLILFSLESGDSDKSC